MTRRFNSKARKTGRAARGCSAWFFLHFLTAMLPAFVVLSGCTPNDAATTKPAAGEVQQESVLAIISAEVNASDLTETVKADVIKNLSETRADDTLALVKTLIARVASHPLDNGLS